ncbi:MAG: hypothetical protein Q9162_001952 [Coniocarpon cinnabarinum]
MADPISALGLAANIVNIVDCGIKLLSKTKALYRSAQTASTDHLNLEIVARDLQSLSGELKAHTQCEGKNVENDPIKSLADQTSSIANDLLETLAKVHRKKGNKALQSLKAVLRAQGEEERIRSTEQSLFKLRDQIVARLIVLMSSSTSKGITDLRKISNDQREKQREAVYELAQVCESEKDWNKFQDLSESLSLLVAATDEQRRQNNVLAGLYFPEIYTRRRNVAEAASDTFAWIFDDAGKFGSGKSTLMKYLASHAKTQELLTAWAQDEGKTLAFGTFFSAGFGTSLQKSQEGLLRSILYELCRKDSSLGSHIIPSLWFSNAANFDRTLGPSWDQVELHQCFTRLVDAQHGRSRFCLFIDGLDEFEGHHVDLAAMLTKLGKDTRIKLCVSSRDWNVFTKAFGSDDEKILILHEHTEQDVEVYVKNRLVSHKRFQQLCEKDRATPLLIDGIVKRAQGVFLWVHIVVASLARGLTNSDNISDLRKRLSKLPNGLHEMLVHILESIEEIYREDSARMLLCCSAAEGQHMPIGAFTLLDGRYNSALQNNTGSMHLGETDSTEMRERIKARCTDLVEFKHGALPVRLINCYKDAYYTSFSTRTRPELKILLAVS